MTARLPLLAAALAVAVVGCGDSAGGGGDADLSGIAEGDPFDQVSYRVGYQSGQQFLGTDSSFSYDRFVEGFNRGLDGDSVEIAYALGLQYGLQVRQDSLGAVNRNLFLAGLRSALSGDSVLVSDAEFQEAQAVVEDSLELRRLRRSADRGDAQARARLDAIGTNATRSDSFLTAVRGRDGVRELGDGVLYTVEQEGEGASPGPDDRVSIRYTGRFADGQVFDQSGDEPSTFAVGQVVPGFRAALLDMQEGERRTVYIPAEQAYGVLGQPGPGGQGGIPPNSALQFDLELVEVVAGGPQLQLPPGLGQ